MQILRALTPATIVAVDTKPAALQMASSLGAHHTVEAGADAADEIIELTRGRGVDATFDLVGSDATLGLALATARAGSRVMLVGAAGGSVPYSLLGDQVRGRAVDVDVGQHQRPSRRDRPRPGRADRAEGQHVRFDQIPDAFRALEDGTLEGRAVIVP